MIAFLVPGQPQGKGRARIVRIGGYSRMATPEATVAYEGLVAHVATQARGDLPLIDGPVAMTLHLDCQVPASWSARKRAQALAGQVLPTTKPDADNVAKAISDGLNGVLWRDDVQVVDLVVRKRYAAVPAVRVEVRPITQEAAA